MELTVSSTPSHPKRIVATVILLSIFVANCVAVYVSYCSQLNGSALRVDASVIYSSCMKDMRGVDFSLEDEFV